MRVARLPRAALDAERVVLALCALWIAAVHFLRWPAPVRESVSSVSSVDAAVFALAGNMLREGGRPYVSYWDHKPPLIHLLNAAALALAGGHAWGPWLLSLAAFLGALLIGHLAMRRAFGRAAALLGTVYFAASLPSILSANLTEGYALPVQWGAALVYAARAPFDDRHLSLGAWLGALAAAGFLLKPTLVGAPVAAAAGVTVLLLGRGRVAAWLVTVAGGAIALVVAGAATAAYLAGNGALGAFWDEVIRYNVVYAGSSAGERARAAWYGLQLATSLGSAALPAAGFLLAAWALARRPARAWSEARGPVLLLALLWPPIELLLAAASGRPFPNYFTQLFPPLSFLTACVGAELAPGAATAATPRRLAPLAALALATAAWSVGSTVVRLRDAVDRGARSEQVGRIASYLRAHTRPDEPIFVWGHAADVYLFSGRRPATRFIYPLPLLTAGYADSALVRGFLAELRAADPPVIVEVSGVGLEGEVLTPPLDHWDPSWGLPTRGYPDFSRARQWWTMAPALRQFYDYVATRYRPAELVGRWRVYRRISPVATAPDTRAADTRAADTRAADTLGRATERRPAAPVTPPRAPPFPAPGSASHVHAPPSAAARAPRAGRSG
ncbi:MAG: glycosyltransferase family 39 protein [Gemmatimonadaceae bacterium]